MVRSSIFSMVVLTTITSLFSNSPANGEQPNDTKTVGKPPVVEVIKEALDAEAAGDFEKRKRLLTQVADQDDSAIAKWHSGHLTNGNDSFETVADSTEGNGKNHKLAKYRKQRTKMPPNAAGHWQMAAWCLDNKLYPQARAHLNRVIDFEPDHIAARQALGFQRVGNEWISPEEIELLAKRSQRKSESIRSFGKQIAKLAKKLKSPRSHVQDEAVAKLMAIKDPSAVGAVENSLASMDVDTSIIAIDWMNQVDTVDSSHVMVRYGLLHPSEMVRQYATSKLASRPFHDFVPELLAMVSSPIRSSLEVTYHPSGFLLGYRHSFFKEGFEDKDTLVVNQRNMLQLPNSVTRRRVAPSAADPNSQMINIEFRRLSNQVKQQAEADVAQRAEMVKRENDQIRTRNKRIAELLAAATELPFTEEPSEMWQWWDEYNETGYQEFKPERYTSTNFTSYNRIVEPNIRIPSCECFVAGTEVMTELGLQPIETIVAGDRVLSRNLTTGELEWKPVLQQTVRPASSTVTVATGEDSFHCTGGHLFWVSGKGWRKASELEKGDVLHGAEQPSRVNVVQNDESLETYNLRVADHNNYFVGNTMVLTHDVTPRQPNRQQVPGQAILQNLTQK